MASKCLTLYKTSLNENTWYIRCAVIYHLTVVMSNMDEMNS